MSIEIDAVRMRMIKEPLPLLRDRITEGVDVRGYIHWSAVDNLNGGVG